MLAGEECGDDQSGTRQCQGFGATSPTRGTDAERRSAFLFVGEGLGAEGAVALLDEELDLAFGFVEFFFAGGGEHGAFFEELDGVFEGEVAFLESFDDGFEFLEGFFEGWHGDSPRILYCGESD